MLKRRDHFPLSGKELVQHEARREPSKGGSKKRADRAQATATAMVPFSRTRPRAVMKDQHTSRENEQDLRVFHLLSQRKWIATRGDVFD